MRVHAERRELRFQLGDCRVRAFRPTEKVREEFRMRVRVITRGMNGLLYMKSLFNPFRHPFVALQLLSHKVLRWCVPVFMLVLLVASLSLAGRSWFFTTALAGQLLFYAFAGLGAVADRLGRRIRIFDLPLYFCVVNFASLVSMVNVLRGERKTIWDTVRS